MTITLRDPQGGGRILTQRGNASSEPAYHPSEAWAPLHDGTMYALANCGRHYGHYPPANVKAGDLPCKTGCASAVWTS